MAVTMKDKILIRISRKNRDMGQKSFVQKFFIDRVAGEIIRLVASVCVSVRLSVCVRVSVCCGHSPV